MFDLKPIATAAAQLAAKLDQLIALQQKRLDVETTRAKEQSRHSVHVEAALHALCTSAGVDRLAEQHRVQMLVKRGDQLAVDGGAVKSSTSAD
ncbi:MAG TPA: hypothetical protein VGN72_04325 [Tepidisphaeraceae bacterium]|jgi:hypothetical protein|nr:hypothetical protein [Tepidisphaeraceae bacterium]